MDLIVNPNPSPEEVVARPRECVRRLLEGGLTFDALQMPIDDPIMCQRLVRYWLAGGREHGTPYKHAKEIMGGNIFGVEEANFCFGVTPSRRIVAYLDEVPWNEEVLQSVKDTHLLIAALPLSVLDIRERLGANIFSDMPPESWVWYRQEHFAKLTPQVNWRLLKKMPISEARASGCEVPSAAFLIYAVLGHAIAKGERLFEKTSLRCSDLTSGRFDVHISFWDRSWVHITDIHGIPFERRCSISVASVKTYQR